LDDLEGLEVAGLDPPLSEGLGFGGDLAAALAVGRGVVGEGGTLRRR
jgi:hypothetical protein